MEIRNLEQAREWLAAWSWKPRRGIALAAIEGLRLAAALSRERVVAARYLAAADLIALHIDQ